MRSQYQRTIILSSQLASASKLSNEMRHNDLLRTLSGWSFDYTEAVGVYKGTEEKSVIVVPRTRLQEKRLRELAFGILGQESILVQDNEGQAVLEFESGNIIKLGKLQPVTEEEAKQLDAYTLVNGQYWTAK